MLFAKLFDAGREPPDILSDASCNLFSLSILVSDSDQSVTLSDIADFQYVMHFSLHLNVPLCKRMCKNTQHWKTTGKC